MNGSQEAKKLEYAQNATVLTGIEKERNNFYVYVWLDPRKPGVYNYGKYTFTHEPIYVGKGFGKRIQNKHDNKILTFKLKKFFFPIHVKVKEDLFEKEAFSLEIKLIKKIGRIDLKTGPLCNFTNGGEGTSGIVMTEETKKNMSLSKKGKKFTDEHKRNIALTKIGKPRSEETKRKLSEINKGKKIPIEIVKKIAAKNKGKKRTDEFRKRMSILNKGRKQSAEFCQKLSRNRKGKTTWMKGKHHTEEAKRKNSIAHRKENLSLETRRKMSESKKLWYKRRKECMNIELVLTEKKLGKTNQDFLKAKETCEKVAACLKKKHDWILDLRFAGDISFKSNRKKASIKDAAEKGEEVSFGLNMIMTYLDEKGKKKETQVIIRHKPKPFYIVALKSYIPNPTRDDLVKQMENVWIYLLSGGTPEKPKAIALTRLDELPIECLTDYSKSQKGKFGIHFSKWVKYVPIGRNILGDDNETELFSKLRKG